MVKRILLALLIVATLPGAVFASAVHLPQTGQTVSAAAGDDGSTKAGLALPTPRFTVVGQSANGVERAVRDNSSGLIWSRSMSMAATAVTWQQALGVVTSRNGLDGLNTPYAGFNDWRMPTINELETLVNVGQTNLITWLTGDVNDPTFLVFTNPQIWTYDSSVAVANRNMAWLVSFSDGTVFQADKDSQTGGLHHVWLVRGPQ